MSNETSTKHYYNGTTYDEKSLTSFFLDILKKKNKEWHINHAASLESTYKARGELLDQKTPDGFCSYFENYRLLVEYLVNLK